MEYWEKDFSKEEVAQRLAVLRISYEHQLGNFRHVTVPFIVIGALVLAFGGAGAISTFAETDVLTLCLTATAFAIVAMLLPLKMLKPVAPTSDEAALSLLHNKLAAEMKRQRLASSIKDAA